MWTLKMDLVKFGGRPTGPTPLGCGPGIVRRNSQIKGESTIVIMAPRIYSFPLRTLNDTAHILNLNKISLSTGTPLPPTSFST